MSHHNLLPEPGIWCVYLLQNLLSPVSQLGGQGNRVLYVGMTNHLSARIIEHNAGKSRATKHGVWEILAVVIVKDRSEAATLEAWLKCGNSLQKRNDMLAMFGLETTASASERMRFKDRAWLWNSRRHFKRTMQAQRDRQDEQERGL